MQGDHADVVRRIDLSSVVLLKNVDGALPLKKPESLALIGSDAGPSPIGPNQFSDQVCSANRNWVFLTIGRAATRVFLQWDGALALPGSLTSFLWVYFL